MEHDIIWWRGDHMRFPKDFLWGACMIVFQAEGTIMISS